MLLLTAPCPVCRLFTGSYRPAPPDKGLEIIPVSGYQKALLDKRHFVFFHFPFSL
jgi:hypothetical protein